MARKPGVRAKNGYWYSEAGGICRYFGRIDAISHAEAMSRLWGALSDDASDDSEVGVWGGDDATNERTSRPRSAPTPGLGDSLVRSQPHSTKPHPKPNLKLSTLPLTVSDLSDRYLDWLRRHRSPRLLAESQRHLLRWCKVDGDALATVIQGWHLDAFQDALAGEGHASCM